MSKILQSAALYCCEGSSDKTYAIALMEEAGGYRVYAEYGKRGAAQSPAEKYAGTDLADAEKIYTKTLNEKLKKGYRAYSGPTFVSDLPAGSDAEAEVVIEPVVQGVRDVVARLQAMKCGPISEDELEPYLANDLFCLEQKYDGKRVELIKVGSNLTATNSSGQVTSILPELREAVLAVNADFELDIEADVVGGGAVMLDILGLDGTELDRRRGDERRAILETFAKGSKFDEATMRLARRAVGSAAKRKLIADLRAENAEGGILKNRLATYLPQDREYWKKCKFVVQGTFIVNKVNTKRSVELAVLDGLRRVVVGNCTVPPGISIPQKDSLVECWYLYARRGGSLIQPTNLRDRSDELSLATKEGQAAVQISQLKYKQGD
jgi:bifunctional non-homologous end joining protein LigD